MGDNSDSILTKYSYSAIFTMPPLLITVLMLTLSNVFMTFAWYGHLKYFHNRVWIIAALVSWGIALFEYLLQVPANRIGYEVASAEQLKIIQEVLSLAVFIPFSLYILKEPFRMDYVWAGLCLLGAVFFMFRDKIMG